jgi:hypothetical protein
MTAMAMIGLFALAILCGFASYQMLKSCLSNLQPLAASPPLRSISSTPRSSPQYYLPAMGDIKKIPILAKFRGYSEISDISAAEDQKF